ncbi:helix-turn-helix transcriptional regulator [Acidaminobacter sp. JC074]|uniref:winged helix-turn-helix transcriptional regulator n=1 Tax=Acidaminobacter sp. JC074 TaxID=2530199 RepID=UPI001F0D28BE|nr:helix-turn-helix domain-containing protein [Acidaminobacter sp. JC074]MCH4887525.1 helix-turn-helix transcriptional regulator [Acidaminobacter sp. JC074]
MPKTVKINNESTNHLCGVGVTISIIGGKWKPLILWLLLQHENRRYGQIKRFIPEVTNKMLSQQLKELISDGLVTRKDYHEIPPKVEYRISEKGKTLDDIIENMCIWGIDHMSDV